MQRVEKLSLKIERFFKLEENKRPSSSHLLLGSSRALSLAPYLSQIQHSSQSSSPQLILVSSDKEAKDFAQSLSFFNSSFKCQTLTSSHEDFSSQLNASLIESSSKNHALKMNWLYRVAHTKGAEIFIISLKALLKKTLPFEAFFENVFSFQKGETLPTHFTSLLDELGYQSSTFVEELGTYSQRGALIDLFCPLHLKPLRIELLGDQIQSLRFFEPKSQRSISQLEDFTLIPAREILFSKKQIQEVKNHLEKKNLDPLLKQKKEEIFLFLKEKKTSPNSDHYLPFFYPKLVSPLSYFKKAFTFWIVDPLKLSLDLREFHENLKVKAKDFPLMKFFYQDLFHDFKHFFFHPSDEKVFHHFGKKKFHPIFISKIEPLSPEYSTFLKEEIKNVKKEESKLKNKKGKEESARESKVKNKEENKNLFKENLKKQNKTLKPIPYNTYEIGSTFKAIKNLNFKDAKEWIKNKMKAWKDEGFKIFLSYKAFFQGEVIQNFFETLGFEVNLKKKENSLGITDFEILEIQEEKNKLHLLKGTLSESLLFEEEKLILIQTEDFLKYLPLYKKIITTKSQKPLSTRSQKPLSIKELSKKSQAPIILEDLKKRDLVSHKLHGVGQFEGLKTMNILGFQSEFLILQYKGNAKLYLPVHRISQVQKWSSSFQSTRKLDQLGSQQWIKTKTKIKKKLRELACDLLTLYAKRLQIKRPPFLKQNKSSSLDPLLDEDSKFANEFPYVETVDQKQAIQDVLKDMTEKENPMDRLICGDVGFGKTEVAMRAAFKAIQSGKQVAVIVPTTLLCFQHKESFTKRFKNWPFRIEALNRFVTKKDIQKKIAHLKEGKIDIVIGTHRLFSQDVEFKNLGLLIIDEEQKFGVHHKEKIRKLKHHVDTLMLSATPIPRTLDFSLSGLKDISLMLTPPQGRLSVHTFICRFEKGLIKKACLNELKRNGQILFIHNRIQSLPSKVFELKELLPNVRIGFAHGQMKEHDLEKTILSFFERKIDLLVCTSIIESGMDIPKTNTLFVDQAQNFGLSQLYQLRGRVGRSHERAYCYFLLAPQYRNKEVEERLRVLKEFSALGSGIRIAQKDLELRGGGNILGAEQSGHIHSLGYHLYMELLEEAVLIEKKKKEKNLTEKKHLSKEDLDRSNREEALKEKTEREEIEREDFEPEIRIPIEALIPESYIPSLPLRLAYYREFSNFKSKDDLALIEEEMMDRFGPLPDSIYNLMDISLIQRTCKILKIKDLSLSPKRIHLRVLNGSVLASHRAILLFKEENKKYLLKPDNRLLIHFSLKKEIEKEKEKKILLSETKKELEFLKDLLE